MQSPCIRDASDACFSSCCSTPFRSQHQPPEPHGSENRISPRTEFVAATASSVQPNSQFTNHESLPSLPESVCYLNKAYPRYSETVLADRIRAEEYYHLPLSNHVCLDYIGHGLFSYSQHQDGDVASTSSSTSELPLFNMAYKNVNLASELLYGVRASEFESSMRKRITKFMNIFDDEYSMVFTANQSSAFKLLADSYPFQSSPNLITVYDFENEAVEAMIESSKTKGARPMSAEFSWPSLRIQSRKLKKMISNKRKKAERRGLFVFPLQSKITGSRYSYQWMNLARENGWHVLLDASALGAKDMETLGLSLFHPDFLICSFFKIFGENPSGFSCLFVKKSSISVLQNTSASFGIVNLVPISKPFEDVSSTDEDSLRLMTTAMHQKQNTENTNPGSSSSSFPQKMEEISEMAETEEKQLQCSKETADDLIKCKGLDHADRLGLVLISSRGRFLINWLINALMSLRQPHSGNGHHHPLVRIYGPKVKLDRGPAVAFNVYDWKGEKVEPFLVQKLADRNNISLGCGFLQNISFSDNYEEERKHVLELRGNRMGEFKRHGAAEGISVITAYIGFLTDFEDMYRLWAFVARFLDADYVEKERWRYKALNQSTVEL